MNINEQVKRLERYGEMRNALIKCVDEMLKELEMISGENYRLQNQLNRQACENLENIYQTTKNQKKEEEAPLLLSIRQTSEKSGLTLYTIRKWANKGIIPSVKIGRKILIPWNKFCKYLNEEKNGNCNE